MKVFVLLLEQMDKKSLKGIDLFVKILSEVTRKEEFQPLEVQVQAHRT